MFSVIFSSFSSGNYQQPQKEISRLIDDHRIFLEYKRKENEEKKKFIHEEREREKWKHTHTQRETLKCTCFDGYSLSIPIENQLDSVWHTQRLPIEEHALLCRRLYLWKKDDQGEKIDKYGRPPSQRYDRNSWRWYRCITGMIKWGFVEWHRSRSGGEEFEFKTSCCRVFLRVGMMCRWIITKMTGVKTIGSLTIITVCEKTS